MNKSFRLTVTPLVLAAANLSAATLYVSLESTNPTPPYATWATAATNIQSAVSAAAGSDEVVVTNGVYGGGLAVTNPLALWSVNGPQFPAKRLHQFGTVRWCAARSGCVNPPRLSRRKCVFPEPTNGAANPVHGHSRTR